VLVVEDDGALRRLLLSALMGAGCSVLAVSNGRDALALVRARGPRHAPDLILLDLEMPVLDGRGFAARYLALPGPHAPIVLISGAHDAHDVATQVSAAALLRKPFDLDDLLACVHHHLRAEVPRGDRGPRRAPRTA
jgi:CheY-like chemotaxis protein